MIGQVFLNASVRATSWPFAMVATVVAAIVAGRAVHATMPDGVAHPLVLATHLYALVLLVGLLGLAAGVGRLLSRRAGVTFGSRLEAGLFAIGVGLGVIAFAVVIVGLLGLLFTPVLLGVVAALGIVARHDLVHLASELPSASRAALALRRSVRQQNRVLGLFLPVAELLFLVLLIQALVPPNANDVLTYHLGGPKRFLDLGRIALLPDLQQANMPLGVNMLYLLGLAFGSDEVGSVLHLAFSAIVAAATFAFGRQFLSAKIGWMAAIAFISTPLLVIFAAVPNVEYGLALFDFLAVYAFFRWRQSEQTGWLVISGLLIGAAMGTKYLGGISAVALGTALLVLAFRSRRALGVGGVIRLVLAFGVPAALIAAPWYLKNLIWFGNPIWPMVGADPDDFNMYHGLNARYPGGVLGWALVPFRLLLDGSVEYQGIRPPLALIVVPLYAVLPKNRVVTGLLAISLLHFLIWVQASHVLRYLVQAMPEICLVAAYVLAELASVMRRPAVGRVVGTSILGVGFLIPATLTFAVVLHDQPFAQLIGLESREQYLDRHLHNSPLVRSLNQAGDDARGVLMVGDDRAFYLNRPVWIDVTLIEFQQIAMASDPAVARAQLSRLGISHVLVNTQDLNWYKSWDPEGRLTRWMDRFEVTKSGYLVVEGMNGASTLYRVVDETAAR